jgi:hypothetical protein
VESEGWVIVAEMAGGRRSRAVAPAWPAALAAGLNDRDPGRLLRPFDVATDGLLVGALGPGADPAALLVEAALAGVAARVRWAAALGHVEAGRGPSPEPVGPAAAAARTALAAGRQHRDLVSIVTGRPHADLLLAGMAAALGDLLATMTPRQKEVARLALVDGLRQADVADRLRIRRATVSVSFARARIATLERLLAAIGAVCATLDGEGAVPPPVESPPRPIEPAARVSGV